MIQSQFTSEVEKLIEKINKQAQGHIAKFEIVNGETRIRFSLPNLLTDPKKRPTSNVVGSWKTTQQIEGEKKALRKGNPWEAISPGMFPGAPGVPFKEKVIPQNADQPINSTEIKGVTNPVNRASEQLELKPSSNIQGAVYYPDKEYLIVSFKSGSSYDYQGVGIWTIVDWEFADSTGSFFYYHIRKNFSYRKIG